MFDCKSLWDAAKGEYDVIMVLGFGPGLLIPFLGESVKSKIVLNFGGLDWKRNKWNCIARFIIRLCEKLLVRNSAKVIADNNKIRTYITKEYDRDSTLIFYGGDQATPLPVTEDLRVKYPFLNGKYAFEVARIQSDNNIEMLMQAFIKARKMPLVLVGNWSSTEWGRIIKAKYEHKEWLVLLEAIYDKKILDVLRSNCYVYVHGHSAGGTNPSLCEAMYLGLPILAFSNGYNENTTFLKARYFKNADDLCNLINSISDKELKEMRPMMREIAEKNYKWEHIAREYEKVFTEVANR